MSYYSKQELEEQKLLNEKYKYQFTCKCGHKVFILPFEKRQKKVCTWCGRNVYTSPEEEKKDRFKTKLRRVIKELS